MNIIIRPSLFSATVQTLILPHIPPTIPCPWRTLTPLPRSTETTPSPTTGMESRRIGVRRATRVWRTARPWRSTTSSTRMYSITGARRHATRPMTPSCCMESLMKVRGAGRRRRGVGREGLERYSANGFTLLSGEYNEGKRGWKEDIRKEGIVERGGWKEGGDDVWRVK
jgi:hypothetical protein